MFGNDAAKSIDELFFLYVTVGIELCIGVGILAFIGGGIATNGC